MSDDGLDVPNCPVDLVRMVAKGEAEDGEDARWVRPMCGLAAIS